MIGERYHYEIGYITNTGNVRQNNQDSLLIRRGSIEKIEIALLAVADGMGGLSHGEQASSLAVHMLDRWWTEQLPLLLEAGFDWTALRNSLSVTIDQINYALYAQVSGGGEKSGTTLTLLFLFEKRYLLLQVGDSRAYYLKENEMTQLTKDQTWCRREIEEGRLTENEANAHPMRHMLLSTLGVTADYTLDVYEGKVGMSDGILLCSDGFYSKMPSDWNALFRKGFPVQDILEQTAARILSGTADDNLTGILVRRETNAHKKSI